MIMEVETRIMRPQAKECLQPPAAKIGKGKKKKKKVRSDRFSPADSRKEEPNFSAVKQISSF